MASSPSGSGIDWRPQDWSGFFGGTKIRGRMHGSLSKFYGFKKDQWKSLLGKGSSLKTLGEGEIKGPEYGYVTEGVEHFKTTPIYSNFLFFKKRTGETRHYRGVGKERTLADLGEKGFVGFESQEKGRAEIDRVLGLFAKRKEEASLRQRAPGRAATMLTTKNKTQLTGY